MALVYVYNDFYHNDPDIYILQNGTIIELVTSCLLWHHRWM